MAKQPCRMEKLKEAYLPHGCKDKQIYFDVGHNPPAIVIFILHRKKLNSLSKIKALRKNKSHLCLEQAKERNLMRLFHKFRKLQIIFT